mmetsp:Transcript_40239/g.114142  ORF Transcript_40239/g.114142 Transcript_40239/m.114142 type:complete len:667 (-) Transcript_40239:62-2062(-)
MVALPDGGDGASPAGCEWPLPEMQQLMRLLEAAARSEEAVCSDEPESEMGEGSGSIISSTDGDILGGEHEKATLEACLKHILKVAQVVASSAAKSDAEAEPALKQLPVAMEELTGLLRGAWSLSVLRGERRRELARRLGNVEAEARTQSQRASAAEAAQATAETDAVHGEKAHEMLEGTLARLTASRKALKDKEWEMAALKRKLEQSEEERTRLDGRSRNLETALERSASCRFEDMDRSCSVFKTLEEVMSKAARGEEKSEDLRRKLTDTEADLLEARDNGERRISDMSERLADNERHAEELERRLSAARVGADAAKAAAATDRQEFERRLAASAQDAEAARATAAAEASAAAAGVLAATAPSQVAPVESDLAERLAASEQRVEDLERRLADSAKEAEAARSATEASAAADAATTAAVASTAEPASSETDRRVEELEDQLSAVQQGAEAAKVAAETDRQELERRLAASAQEAAAAIAAAAASAAAASSTKFAPPSRAARPGESPEGSGDDEAADGVSALRPRIGGLRVGGLHDLSSLREQQQDQYVEGVGILVPTPRTGLRNSLSNRGGVDAASAQRHPPPLRLQTPASLTAVTSTPTAGHSSGKARLVSPARIEREKQRQASGQTPVRQGRRSSGGTEATTPSMPMDLRALGNLLTGGGLAGRKK